MKIFCSILLFITILFTSCTSEVDSQIESEKVSLQPSENYFQSDKTGEELVQEITDIYNENNVYSYSELDNFNIENGDFRVTAYEFYKDEYTDNIFIVCRFEKDELIGYIKVEQQDFAHANLMDDYINFYCIFDFECSEDLSYVKAKTLYDNNKQFILDFKKGSFVCETGDGRAGEFSYMQQMNEQQIKNYVEQNYLIPLAKAGLLGGYYKETDKITKFIDFYAQNYVYQNLDSLKNECEYDGEYIYIPYDKALEYFNKKFYKIENYAFKYNQQYVQEKNAFKIPLAQPQDNFSYAISMEDHYLSQSGLDVDYIVYDQNKNIIAKEKCVLYRVNDNFLFDVSYDQIEEEQTAGQRYTFSLENAEGGGDAWSYEVVLTDNETGKTKNLGREYNQSAICDYGFFSNGDVYVMNYGGLTVFDTDMDNPNPIFTTKTNFPCTLIDQNSSGHNRYMFSIRRDPVTFEYVVIYGEYEENEDYYSNFLNDFQMKYNYKIGVLDKDGNLIKSWDTGVPIMFTAFGFENVYMKKVGDSEFEMFVTYKYEERIIGKFNIEIQTYTPVKVFNLYEPRITILPN